MIVNDDNMNIKINIWKRVSYKSGDLFLTRRSERRYAERGRSWFEDLMGYYRYSPNAGWSHTEYIADNFKAIDFYKKTSEVADEIFASSVVSVKTTTATNVNEWLETAVIKNNIQNIRDAAGEGLDKGITWNRKTIRYHYPEMHIYMPKDNLMPALKQEWLNKLTSEYPTVKFELYTLDEFVK